MSSISEYLVASIPGARLVADDRQILCRCPICMDSDNPSNAHFYIGPLKDRTRPLMYNCKKCDARGFVSYKLLSLFGIYDTELSTMVAEYNAKITSNPSWMKSMSYEGVIHKMCNTDLNIHPEALVNNKINYINSRIGTNLTKEQILGDKIVLHLEDFLMVNHVKNLTRADSIVKQLDTHFIGFLSYDSGYLNMRRLCNEGVVYDTIDKRYVNYNIFNTVDNSMRFYVIPTTIDLMIPDPIHVWITEGPFDILSIKYNVDPYHRSIYIAVGGKSYIVGAKFVLATLGLPNIVLHICPDGDVSDRYIRYVLSNLYPFNIPTYIHRNVYAGEKDFGVPKDRIQEIVY